MWSWIAHLEPVADVQSEEEEVSLKRRLQHALGIHPVNGELTHDGREIKYSSSGTIPHPPLELGLSEVGVENGGVCRPLGKKKPFSFRFNEEKMRFQENVRMAGKSSACGECRGFNGHAAAL